MTTARAMIVKCVGVQGNGDDNDDDHDEVILVLTLTVITWARWLPEWED